MTRARLASIAIAAAVATSAAADELVKPVSFEVRLCEAEKSSILLGEEADESWSRCEKPLVDVPVGFSADDAKSDRINTDATGTALLEPLEGEGVSDFRVLAACTTHLCLTYRIHPKFVEEGKNRVLYYTIPQPPPPPGADPG